jgi:GT2 family glycosyltransferase
MVDFRSVLSVGWPLQYADGTQRFRIQCGGDTPLITVSIVSHDHGAMVDRLVSQLRDCPQVADVILTRNIPETSGLAADGHLEIVGNVEPKGFGANHNAAFARCRQPFYCVLNPDIELIGNPFPELLASLGDLSVAVSAPLIAAPDGKLEDSVRHFPTVSSLLGKALGGSGGRFAIPAGPSVFYPDWVAGMFILFRSSAYERLGGFDEGFFLYYEDVDICRRIWREGMKVAACPSATAIHAARRDSHRNLRHLRWHLASMARYLARR